MSLDFSGVTSGYEKKDLPKEVKKFVEEAKTNPTLQENNIGVYDKEEIGRLERRFKVFKNICIFLILVILTIGGTFAYLTYQGKFQSNINQNLSCPPVNISCPDIPSQPACPNPAPIYINATCNPIIRCGGNSTN